MPLLSSHCGPAMTTPGPAWIVIQALLDHNRHLSSSPQRLWRVHLGRLLLILRLTQCRPVSRNSRRPSLGRSPQPRARSSHLRGPWSEHTCVLVALVLGSAQPVLNLPLFRLVPALLDPALLGLPDHPLEQASSPPRGSGCEGSPSRRWRPMARASQAHATNMEFGDQEPQTITGHTQTTVKEKAKPRAARVAPFSCMRTGRIFMGRNAIGMKPNQPSDQTCECPLSMRGSQQIS